MLILKATTKIDIEVAVDIFIWMSFTKKGEWKMVKMYIYSFFNLSLIFPFAVKSITSLIYKIEVVKMPLDKQEFKELSEGVTEPSCGVIHNSPQTPRN